MRKIQKIKEKLVIAGGKFLRFLWAKDTWVIFTWRERKDWKLIKNWFFKWTLYPILQEAKCFFMNFKWYVYNDTIIQSMLKWLDDKSKTVFNRQVKAMKLFIETKELIISKDMLWLEVRPMVEFYKKIKYWKKKYILPINHWEESVFIAHHWMHDIPDIEKRVKDKDVIDCGWFIWDSALIFVDQLPIKKVFCIEPNNANFWNLKKTINFNKMEDKIIPLKMWVWDKRWTLFLVNNGICSFISVKNEGEKIEVDTIDNIVASKRIIPGMIKRDIEWYEYESLLWAEQTIKKYKPILIISIYHRWKDYFEVKPLLESWNVWYKFMIRQWITTHPLIETVLLCY